MLLKNVKVTKVKKPSQLKEKRKHPLNATWNPGSDPGVEKGHSWKNECIDMTGKMREIPIRSIV